MKLVNGALCSFPLDVIDDEVILIKDEIAEDHVLEVVAGLEPDIGAIVDEFAGDWSRTRSTPRAPLPPRHPSAQAGESPPAQSKLSHCGEVPTAPFADRCEPPPETATAVVGARRHSRSGCDVGIVADAGQEQRTRIDEPLGPWRAEGRVGGLHRRDDTGLVSPSVCRLGS